MSEAPRAAVPALPSWLRDVLRCPACHGELTDVAAGAGADADPGLVCGGCGRRYPVRDGVPVLLVDEAGAGDQRTEGTH